MPNNFRLSGALYVSKAGSDTNAGNDPNAPLATLKNVRGAAGGCIIGTGSYRMPLSNAVTGDNVQWFGDTRVTIIGDGLNQTLIGPNQGGNMRNLYYDKFAGFNFHGIYSGINIFDRCILKVISENANTLNSQGANDKFINCVIINVNGGSPLWVFENCLFFNSTISNSSSLKQCYIDPSSSVVSAGASFCNVDPRCQTASNYGLSINGGAFGYASTGGISALPGFNSLAREDWSLQKSSPHIALGIGPVQYRYSNTCFLEFSGTPGDIATTTNTQLRFAGSGSIVRLKSISASPDALTFNNQGGLIRIANSNGNGYSQFLTQRIPFSDIPQEITVINIFAGLNIDTDAVALENQISLAAPSPYNNNAPDYNNWSSGHAGRNPNRLTFRARWSTLIDPDVDNPDHWVSGASFIEFEWGSKPTWIQSLLLGNGNPNFNPNDSAAVGIVARFLQIEVTLRDNYFSK